MNKLLPLRARQRPCRVLGLIDLRLSYPGPDCRLGESELPRDLRSRLVTTEDTLHALGLDLLGVTVPLALLLLFGHVGHRIRLFVGVHRTGSSPVPIPPSRGRNVP